MRLVALIPLFLIAAGLGAAPISTEAEARLALLPHELFDENGAYRPASGDQTIWPTYPARHAPLEVQLTREGTELPAPRPGHVTRRPGIEGVRIYVESNPPGIPVTPQEGFEDWQTNAHGVFGVLVQVPPVQGECDFTFRTDDPEVRTLTLSLSVKSPNWLLWLALGMLGGLALFLYGMTVGSEGLQECAGGGFRDALHTLTRRPVRGLAAGTVLTIFTQSSSATTVMLVGFVRAGLMNLRQTLGPIFGAAIGTTLTVQLISFKVQTFALPMMAVGFGAMFFGARSPRARAIGKIIFGFGMIFFGMAVMGEVIEPLKSSPTFREMVTHLTSRPLWCLIFVTVFTALIQSSAATIGIALTLASQGLLDLHGSLAIIFGANIGTCITALLASVGGTADAKRVALAHLLYKVATVAVFFFWFMPDVLAWMATAVSHQMAAWFPSVPFLADTTTRQIANADTVLAVLSATLGMLFLRPPLERAVTWLIPAPTDDGKSEGRAKYLDLALLDSPALALGAATREISRMGRLVEEMLRASEEVVVSRDPAKLQWMRRRDDKVDRAFARTNKFLTKFTATKPGQEVNDRAIALLYVINDLESIGDQVVKILIPLIDKMIDNNLQFSEDGQADIAELHALVSDSLTKAMVAMTTAAEVELFEEVIRRQEELQVLGRRLHLRHLRRLQEGTQKSVETSSVHLDILNYLLRVHYHIFSVAWAAGRGVSTHEETP